ncbi:MAG: hypothetical protein L0G25_00630 [Psychrobacter sp.]|nr:hypothetical protein [Psychrobacter sp.]
MILFSRSSLAITASLALLLTVTGCQSLPSSTAPADQSNASDTSNNPVTTNQSLTEQALRIQSALANNDYASIINDIHPTLGVRFSMYAYVRPQSDKVFSRAQFTQYLQQSNIRFTWGEKDGVGDLLVIPLPEYLKTWVNAEQFDNQPTISVNDSKAIGNSINNLTQIYQNSDFVEFYHGGSEQYSGMDWRAMRLVFDEYQGQRYLVAIINDQWTV